MSKRFQSGYSLLEILTVVAIIGTTDIVLGEVDDDLFDADVVGVEVFDVNGRPVFEAGRQAGETVSWSGREQE